MFRRDTAKCVAPRTAAAVGTAVGPSASDSQPLRASTTLHFARLIVVIPPGAEFASERRCLRSEIFPEVLQYAAQMGVDVEFLEHCPEPQLASEAADVAALFQRDGSYMMCFIGDRYGECALPLNMRTAEFEAIRSTACEASNDVRLLDQYYVLDRSRNPPEYRLKGISVGAEQRRAIVATLQRSAKQAYDEGAINQITPKLQQRFFSSPIEFFATLALQQPQKSIFVLRRIEGAQYSEANAEWIEKEAENREKVENLKNRVSAANGVNVLSFTVQPETSNLDSWLQNRAHDRYVELFARQAIERLCALISSIGGSRLLTCSALEIAMREHSVHEAFANAYTPAKWTELSSVDERIAAWTAEPLKSAYIHIAGHEASGKTALLCRLRKLLQQKQCYVITRFVNLTHSSNFAHEFWHGICMSICFLSGQSEKQMQCSFHLSSTLSILKSLLQKLDRPVCVLVDDANLLKYGRVLSALERPFRKMLPNFLLIATSCSPSQIPFMPSPQTFSLPDFTDAEIIKQLKDFVSGADRKLTADQYGLIRHQLVDKNRNTVIGKMLVEEMLEKGNCQIAGGIEERLARIEADFGSLPVCAFAQLLSVSPQGLTSLELLDALSEDSRLAALFTDYNAFPPFLLYSIIKSFGCLLIEFIYGSRVVYKWSHIFVGNAVRHRYLTNTAELKKAHSLLADMFADVFYESEGMSPRSTVASAVFPRPLKRDDGSVNIRKVNNLWYHLLHTGNMDALKELALCHFDYIDACARSCGLAQLLSLYEECSMQVLHHDIQVLCEQVLLPSLSTVVRDCDQLAAELIGRLRYTRAENSHFLNTMVEQAMSWVDTYSKQPLLVPLTCWISPPKMKQVLSFELADWKSSRTIVQPTHNHQHLLISGNDRSQGLIYMYHIASQLLIRTFAGHTDRVTSISISSDGQFFVSTSLDKTVRIWSFAQNDAVRVVKPHNGRVMCSAVSADCSFAVTGGTDSRANVISIETGATLRSFKEHTGTVISLAITSDDEFLVTGSGDFVVMVWDLTTGALAVRLAGLMAPVSCIAMTSNDAFVAVACEDETLRVFSLVSGQELHELSGHDGKILAVAAAHDDCQLFAATTSSIYAYDLHNGKLLDVLDCANPLPVTSLKITSDNYFLLSACGDRVHVWNIHHRSHETDLAFTDDQQGVVTGIGMARDEKSAACATRTGVVAFWDLDICQCIWTVVQRKGIPVVCVKFTSDCSHLLSGDAEGQINIWDATSGRLVRTVHQNSAAIESILCLSDGVRVLSADSSNTVTLWNLHSSEEGSVETERPLSFNSIKPPVFVTPNNLHIVGHFPSSNKEMKIWTLGEDSITPKTKVYHNELITCYCTTASGTLLVTGSADQSLKIWQIESGFLTQVLVGHEAEVTCCAVAEDERLVVSGGRDSQIIIWNVSTGDALLSLHTTSPIVAISVTLDATVVFSADETGWVEAFDTEHGKLLSSFNAHGSIESLVSSVDGNRILVLLSSCAQLPILCLHNTPAGSTLARPTEQRRRSARTHSISSLNSNISEPKVSIGGGGAVGTPMQTSTLAAGSSNANGAKTTPRTFDKMERSKSRASIEKDRATNSMQPVPSGPPPGNTTKSSLCSLL